MFFAEPFLKTITKARLQIDGELLDCGLNFIHIPGITRVWVSRVTKPINWETLFLLALAFIIIFALKFTGLRAVNPISHLSALIGVGKALFLLFLIVLAVAAYIFNILRLSGHGLHVELASGHVYVFLTRDRDFLPKAYKLLGELIKAGPHRAGVIDFQESTAQDSTPAMARPVARRPAAQGEPGSSPDQLVKELGRLLLIFREHHPQNINSGKRLELALASLKAGDQRNFQQLAAGLPPYLAQLAEQAGLAAAGRLLAGIIPKAAGS